MADSPVIPLPAPVLESNDFLVFKLFYHFAGHLCAFEQGGADLDFTAILIHHDLGKGDFFPGCGSEFLDRNRVSGVHPILLASGTNCCARHGRCTIEKARKLPHVHRCDNKFFTEFASQLSRRLTQAPCNPKLILPV